MDDLNVGDKVIYKEQNAVVVDHYGAGNYAIELNGEWVPVTFVLVVLISHVFGLIG